MAAVPPPTSSNRTEHTGRTAPRPDPAALFKDYWQLQVVPLKGIDPTTADPLKVFRGYWKNDPTNQ